MFKQLKSFMDSKRHLTRYVAYLAQTAASLKSRLKTQKTSNHQLGKQSKQLHSNS